MRGLLLVGALGLEISFLLLFARQAASVVGGFGILSQEKNSFTESLIPADFSLCFGWWWWDGCGGNQEPSAEELWGAGGGSLK
jgi:hypothetical protein